MTLNLKNHVHLLLLVAIICFVIGWAAAGGHTLFGTDVEWLFAGLVAFAAAHIQ